MSAPLVIAVPAKGRLQENAEAFFARAGMTLRLSTSPNTAFISGTVTGWTT